MEILKMGEKLDPEKREKIYQRIQNVFKDYEEIGDDCVICGELIEYLGYIIEKLVNVDNEWAIHIGEFCEEKIYQEKCCDGFRKLLDIAKLYIDINSPESIEKAKKIFKYVLDKMEQDGYDGEYLFYMAVQTRRLDIKKSNLLYEKSIDIENKPARLMIIGDNLGGYFDSENTSLEALAIHNRTKFEFVEPTTNEKLLQTKAYSKAYDIIISEDSDISVKHKIGSLILLASSVTYIHCGNNEQWGIKIYNKSIELAVEHNQNDQLENIAESIEDSRWGNNPEWAEEVRNLF